MYCRTRVCEIDMPLLAYARCALRPLGVDYSARQLDLVREIRPRLIDRYRKLPDEDLLPASIVFVGRKPARP